MSFSSSVLYRTYKLSPSARVCICRYNTAAHVVNSTYKNILLCLHVIEHSDFVFCKPHLLAYNKIHTPHMYIQFSVLSPFQRFILISAFYPHFSFRFQFQFPPFSFSVLSQPFVGIYPPENNFCCFVTQSSGLASGIGSVPARRLYSW